MQQSSFLERYFDFKSYGTTMSQEVYAGITTFMAMAYLIFVIPSMLHDGGIPKDAAIGATILVTIVITLLMGIWAKYPVGVAPGLGITAYFAYYICGPAGYSWQAGLGCVFISGVVFFFLTVTQIRQYIINSIPMDLKLAIVVVPDRQFKRRRSRQTRSCGWCLCRMGDIRRENLYGNVKYRRPPNDWQWS